MWTKRFNEFTKNDAASAGGKGASLGEMTRAGIPVPPGYVILSNAFEKFIEASDINIEIDAILKTVNVDAMHTVENASEQIQRLILEEKEIPQEIEQEILNSFNALSAEFVAVRSSATAEDSAEAAWAGQLDSFLNTTEATLLKNVRRCWASLFTPRAIFYRFEKQLDQSHISVAVVVQKMVNSDAAGIAFSVHPVTEDRNQLIIEAGFGLGEAVVSGQITPDSYVVTKEPRKILDKNVIEQKRGLFRKQSGGNEWRDIQDGGAQVLSDPEIFALSETVITIENHYGFPCDIEWAKEGNEVYIVQSRPITTLSVLNDTERNQSNLHYSQHERDYSLLGTSVVFHAYHSSGTSKLFRTENNPYFIKIENDILYHYIPDADSHARAVAYVQNNLASNLQQQKKEHDIVLKNYRAFLLKKPTASKDNFLTLFDFFEKLLPLILVSIEVPEYVKTLGQDMAQLCAAIRSENEDVYKVGFSALEEMLKENQNLKYLTLQEFKKHLETQKIPPEILSRKSFVLVRQLGDKEEVFSNKNSLAEFGLENRNAETVSVLNGTTAYKGKVVGRVRLIRKVADADKLQNNEVLVTAMTDPRYISAIKKASAIVTDEGGITCHAAIVSREMKKPCIIGTKIATQVLKDGDLVEVDANEGVVRIIEKI